jgi:hypothetical protein
MSSLAVVLGSTVAALGLRAVGAEPASRPLLDPQLAALLPLAWVCVGLVLIRRVGPRGPGGGPRAAARDDRLARVAR